MGGGGGEQHFIHFIHFIQQKYGKIYGMQKTDAEIGCRGGNRYFEGLGDSWKSLKFTKWVFHKYK